MATTDYLAPVLQVVGIVGLPAIAYFVNRGLTILEAHTKLRLTEQQRASVLGAIETAAGQIALQLSKGRLQLADVDATSPAVHAVAAAAVNAVPEASGALNVTAVDAARMIAGRVGNDIAADPTVPTVPTVPTLAANATRTS